MSLSAFARRYLRNHGCFLFLWLLRCFTSPGSLSYRMHSGMSDHKWPGFPIQKSTDRSLFASSPWLIAGYNVFHRLSMPRHPPYALNSFINPTSNRLTPAIRQVHALERYIQRPVHYLPSLARGTRDFQQVRGKHLKRLHSVLLQTNSATPKNLSTCQRACRTPRRLTLPAAAGRGSCSANLLGVT